ncbi:3-hydroxyacyl-ACP dehydratase FabZ family protein [Cupriavidus nantongensis]|uniref:3-hydroxyacyl-ACP dehydratase FabZ family protein n=1 Tax=Cupriavidus nantongensis TaxID=1796606 RepID=UPI00358E3C43
MTEILPHAVWIECSEYAAAAVLDVGAHLPIFDGHFPGTPIVPGVAQIDWAMALAPQRLPVPPRERFARLDVLKFQGIIRPGAQVRLDLEWQPEKLALAFRLSSASGPHASGRIVFRSEHG